MLTNPPTPTCRLSLKGTLNTFSIQDQWEKARTLFGFYGGDVVVDLSGITDLDETGIKMLSTLGALLPKRGCSFKITGLRAEWRERMGTSEIGRL